MDEIEGGGGDLSKRIEDLRKRLEGEVARVNESHRSELESLAAECSNTIKSLTKLFDERLAHIQQKHKLDISIIEQELAYLRELSDSQRLMLLDNVEYIKALELRHFSAGSSQEA